jgi:hypothetical protein
MPNMHLDEAKRTQHSKVQKIVGHTENYKHPTEKAADMAYYENQNLDPLTLPATEKVGP